MQELAGRLTALDPEASASLKVIASFDALVAGGVGIEALVRAAAVLGGTIAGARIGGHTTRVDADGRVAPEGDAAQWPQVSDGDATVWRDTTPGLRSDARGTRPRGCSAVCARPPAQPERASGLGSASEVREGLLFLLVCAYLGGCGARDEDRVEPADRSRARARCGR